MPDDRAGGRPNGPDALAGVAAVLVGVRTDDHGRSARRGVPNNRRRLDLAAARWMGRIQVGGPADPSVAGVEAVERIAAADEDQALTGDGCDGGRRGDLAVRSALALTQ